MAEHFFHWMTSQTPTLLFHDTAVPEEIDRALARGATGVTCNPLIAQRRIQADPALWAGRVLQAQRENPNGSDADLALRLVNWVVFDAAEQLDSVYRRTGGRLGIVTGQVNPLQMDEAGPMLEQALAAVALRPNIAMKIPATKAGIEVVEELAARGVTTVSTVSYSVAQAIVAQEAYERGRARACRPLDHAINYSVMIIGRLDNYLIKEAERRRLDVPQAAIESAGMAVTKRLNRLFAQRGYPGMILTGGMQARHIAALAGARMCLTVNAVSQDELLEAAPPHQMCNDEPVAPEHIRALEAAFPEFRQAYEEDGLTPDQFTAFGPCRAMHDWFIEAFNAIADFVRAHRVDD